VGEGEVLEVLLAAEDLVTMQKYLLLDDVKALMLIS
jgi:hypothetical protein